MPDDLTTHELMQLRNLLGRAVRSDMNITEEDANNMLRVLGLEPRTRPEPWTPDDGRIWHEHDGGEMPKGLDQEARRCPPGSGVGRVQWLDESERKAKKHIEMEGFTTDTLDWNRIVAWAYDNPADDPSYKPSEEQESSDLASRLEAVERRVSANETLHSTAAKAVSSLRERVTALERGGHDTPERRELASMQSAIVRLESSAIQCDDVKLLLAPLERAITDLQTAVGLMQEEERDEPMKLSDAFYPRKRDTPSESDEGWHDHDVLIEVRYRDGATGVGMVSDFVWHIDGSDHDIISWRLAERRD